MKKIFLSVIALTIIALTCPSADGQNNVWSLPPFYKISGNLNTLPIASDAFYPGSGVPNDPNDPTDGYDGQVSEYMHNAMQDVNGDLSFFVVDGMVYDKEGYLMGILSYSYGNTMPGYAEISIVPVPGNCNQYYIVTTRDNGIHTEPTLSYGLLDLTVFNSTTQKDGAFVDISTGLEILIGDQTTFPLNINQFAWHQGYVSIATTKLRSDNTRFLFAFNGAEIYRFKVASNGIFYDNYKFDTPFADGDGVFRSEMEVIETTSGYRVALSYPNDNCNTCVPVVPAGITLFIGELNNIGTILSNNTAILSIIPPTSNFSPDIKGIEFSPNGNYVYITHDPTNTYPTPFKIYDVATQNFLSNASINNPQLISDITNFNNSQIELGKDGKLYLANSTSLATIDNANNPYGGLNWNNTAQTISYNLNTLGFPQSGVSTRWIYPLPDQIDGMDYTESFFINTACCIENTAYNIESSKANEEQYGTQTWSGNGNNPFVAIGNTVTVKDKLVIKTGANITINNMVFKFAPEALLMIENGARLTINGTTLTVEDGCDLGKLMWHGVEVRGNGANQFATSGWFMARNNSKIEHAIEATCNYQHDLTNGSPAVNVMVANSTGGILQLTNTTLRNNVFDVNMIKYQRIISGNLLNDLSFFKNCTFVTENLLNDPLQTLAVHARLSFVNGILFSGCDFQNTAPAGTFPYLLRGTGIQAEETKFMVTSGCTSTSFPCPIANIDKSHFNNLTRGVTAFSNNALKSVQIINSEFYDNWRGIFLRGLNVANVSNNIFDIGMSSGSISTSTVSYGLNLTHCDGYKVENNEFKTSFNGYLGCYVDNSMAGANEIYRNTFNNLVIGSQAVNINGDGTSVGKGLEFRCNQYTETSDYDILVSSGRVKAFHGSCATNQSPSNNQFSYTAQYGDFWMTNNTTPSGFNVSYQFSQPNGYNLEPRDYPNSATHYNNSNTFPSYCSTIFNPLISCPIKVAKTTSQLKAEMAALQLIINDLKTQIDGGNTQGLLNLIATTSGGNLKNALLAASPYLSDEVLVAYILSHPSNGNLKLVLLANSPLSSEVLAVLENISLPQGVANQITAAQTGISPRQELESEISYYEGEITKAQNDIIRILLFEESEDSTRRNFKDVADFLQEDEINNTTKENQLLVNAFMADENFTAAQQKINALATCSCVETLNFCKLKNTIVQCQQYPEKEMVLTTNTSLQQTVNEVATSTTSRQEVTSAQVLLEEVGLNPVILEEIEIITPPSGLRMMNPTETVNGAAISTFVNLFPNPTSNQFTLTHNLALDNGTITLTVFDLMGRKLISEQLNATETVVNTRNLKAGIYFYTVTQNNQSVKTDKLVIE